MNQKTNLRDDFGHGKKGISPALIFERSSFIENSQSLESIFRCEFRCFILFRNFVQKLLTTDRNERIGKGEVCQF